jgi:hypothetical protein
VSTFEKVVETVRATAGADFAFVLTRRGRLVTSAAPREMPEAGRMQLVEAAKPLAISGDVGEVILPRQDLVPYGGAAPIDVYLGVAAEQAILCAVVPTWGEKIQAIDAVRAGLAAIEQIIVQSGREPLKRRKTLAPPPATKSAHPPAKSVPPPARSAKSVPPPRGATAGLVTASGAATRASRVLEKAPVIQRAPMRSGSLPEISVGEAVMGRETLAAVEHEESERRAKKGRKAPSAPQITVGEGTLGRESLAAIDMEVRGKRSSPQISIAEGTLGRESLAAIDAESGRRSPEVRVAIRPPATSMPEAVRLELESDEDFGLRVTPLPDSPRATQPWVELPADAKRADDADRMGRKLSPPKVSLKLEIADEDTLDAALSEGLVNEPPKRRK